MFCISTLLPVRGGATTSAGGQVVVESQQELSKPQRQDAKALPNVRSLPRLATEFLDQRSGRVRLSFRTSAASHGRAALWRRRKRSYPD